MGNPLKVLMNLNLRSLVKEKLREVDGPNLSLTQEVKMKLILKRH